MALKLEDAEGSYIKTLPGLQKGKYQKRSTVYVFKCVRCSARLEYPKSGLHKRSGRCRKCAERAGVDTNYPVG